MNALKNVNVLKSSNENVKKFVFKGESKIAESVLYKYPSYKERTVMCISTQSGCAMGCTFCGASSGLIGNMTSEEITYQVKEMLKHVDCDSFDIANWQIMFMSMGEPMHNYAELKKSILVFNAIYPNAKLLISTAAPESPYWDDLERLSQQVLSIGLQFSVHESRDNERDLLIPNKKKLSLKKIGEVGRKWHRTTNRRPFFNYCVHEKNNKDENVFELMENFPPNIFESTISVICEKDETMAQSIERQAELARNFSNKMLEAGYSTRVFNPAGQDDIGGGCGQLWQVQKFLKQKASA